MLAARRRCSCSSSALVQRYGGRAQRRGRRAWSPSLSSSIVVPLALRGRGQPPPLESRPLGDRRSTCRRRTRAARVTVIALDAGSLDSSPTRPRKAGCRTSAAFSTPAPSTHLATLHPTSAEAVWAAVATGKLPQKNGVRSAAVYRLAGRPDDVRSAAARLLLRDRPGAVRLPARGAAHVGVAAHAHAVGNPERGRHPRRRRQLSADLSGARRPRLCRQRRVRAAAPTRRAISDPAARRIRRICCPRRDGRRCGDADGVADRPPAERSSPSATARRRATDRIYERLHRALERDARRSQVVAAALSEPRSDRPLLSALCDAVARSAT